MHDISKLYPRVTYHAVTRYIQRVLNIQVPHAPDDEPQHIAHLHCRSAGTTITHIRSLILTPPVAFASLARLSHVGTKDFIAKLDQTNGAIMSIIVVDHKHKNTLTLFRPKCESGRFRRSVTPKSKWSTCKSKKYLTHTSKVEMGVQRKTT